LAERVLVGDLRYLQLNHEKKERLYLHF
jgi:hypothetical protein